MVTETRDVAAVGAEMHALMARLYPICRSITGDGVRETLAILGERIPIEAREVPSGTPAFDWKVPREWNIRDAYIRAPSGEKLVDFKESNLHVVGYSVPVNTRMPLSQLREHLHSLPEFPDRVPYLTSFYNETWGFCLSHSKLQSLEEGEYEVVIDSTLEDGHLTYGECYLRGEIGDEVLVSAHVCHPSLCNDNLSGVLVAVYLAEELARRPQRRYSYRFLFAPGTIGAITWLALNEERVDRIKHGLVATCLGDAGPFTYKKSRRGDAEIDRAVAQVLRDSGEEHRTIDFEPYGYDERQFCSPAFNLPVGSLTRTTHGEFSGYHSSDDNLEFVRAESLGESLRRYLEVVELLEGNRTYVNLNPKCEPQLGRRGLYRTLGHGDDDRSRELALLWVLSLSDGEHSLLEIAERSGMRFAAIREAADALLAVALLREAGA